MRLIAAAVDDEPEQHPTGLIQPDPHSVVTFTVPESLNLSVIAPPGSANEGPIIGPSSLRDNQSQIVQCIRDAQESNLIDPLLNPHTVAQFLRTFGLGISLLSAAHTEHEIMRDSHWSAVWERVLESLQPHESSSSIQMNNAHR